jgi:hypothetical protein
MAQARAGADLRPLKELTLSSGDTLSKRAHQSTRKHNRALQKAPRGNMMELPAQRSIPMSHSWESPYYKIKRTVTTLTIERKAIDSDPHTTLKVFVQDNHMCDAVLNFLLDDASPSMESLTHLQRLLTLHNVPYKRK